MPWKGSPEEVKAKFKARYDRERDRLLAEKREYYKANRERIRARAKAHAPKYRMNRLVRDRVRYYEKRELLLQRKREAYWRDPEKFRKRRRASKQSYFPERKKAWRELNKEEINRKNRERRRRKPAVKIATDMRCRINTALRRQSVIRRRSSLVTLLGCTVAQLVAHIESKFKPGMSWANRKLWHIDHIEPCASFDLTDQAQQAICFHWSNLEPIWASENLRKGAKRLAQADLPLG